MQMLYNSDNFAVVRFDIPSLQPTAHAADTTPAVDNTPAVADTPDAAVPLPQDALLSRGGYEIVDKFARKEIFLEGAMAQHFKEGVEALIKNSPSQEELDEYIGRFTQLAQQPVVLH